MLMRLLIFRKGIFNKGAKFKENVVLSRWHQLPMECIKFRGQNKSRCVIETMLVAMDEAAL
jgi:hypothetical protein